MRLFVLALPEPEWLHASLALTLSIQCYTKKSNGLINKQQTQFTFVKWRHIECHRLLLLWQRKWHEQKKKYCMGCIKAICCSQRHNYNVQKSRRGWTNQNDNGHQHRLVFHTKVVQKWRHNIFWKHPVEF